MRHRGAPPHDYSPKLHHYKAGVGCDAGSLRGLLAVFSFRSGPRRRGESEPTDSPAVHQVDPISAWPSGRDMALLA